MRNPLEKAASGEPRDEMSRGPARGHSRLRPKMPDALVIVVGVALLVAVVAAVATIASGPGVVSFPSGSGTVSEPDPIAEDPEDGAGYQVDWDSYPDSVIAWVRVPDTDIDCPMTLGPADDPTYYLTHDAWGSYDVYGTPYVSSLCAQGLQSPDVIVYGHHMSDGSMFADFALMKFASYAEDHSIIDLYLRSDGSFHELHVVGVNVVDADEEGPVAEFADSATLMSYLKGKLAESEVVIREPAAVSRLYTFVTCSYDTSNGRTLVYAIEEGGA